MTIKLRSVVVSLVMAGAAVAAVAQAGNLIGVRYAAFDLGYVTWDDGGHLTGANLELNVPSTIKNLDLGFEVGYGSGGYDGYDQDQWSANAIGVYYSRQQGFTPYVRGVVGYTHVKGSYMGYSASDSSLTYGIGAGVEVPLTDKATLDLRLSYSDAKDFAEADTFDARIAVNYAINEKLALRFSYSREFDNDANTVTGGLVFHY